MIPRLSTIHRALGLAAAAILWLCAVSGHASSIKIRSSNVSNNNNNNNNHHPAATLRGRQQGAAKNNDDGAAPLPRRRHLTEQDKHSIRIAYGLKAEAELPLQSISPAARAVTVNSKEYSLDGLTEVRVRTSGFTATTAGEADGGGSPVDDVPPPQHKYFTSSQQHPQPDGNNGSGAATTTTAPQLRAIRDAGTGEFTELLIHDDGGTEKATYSLVKVEGDELDDGLFVTIRGSDYDADSFPAIITDETITAPAVEDFVDEAEADDNAEQLAGAATAEHPSSRRRHQRQRQRQRRELQLSDSCPQIFHVEVAVRFDSTLCAEYGNSRTQTVTRIEDVVFMASTNYEIPGLCVTLRLVHVEGFCPGDAGIEPLRNEIVNGNPSALLYAFADYQSASPVRRDVFHLFVGKRFSPSFVRGTAFNGLGLNGVFVNGVVCYTPRMAGIDSMGTSSLLVQSLLFAHELAHNLGANHIANPAHIMNDVLMNPIDGFSAVSIGTMATFLQLTTGGSFAYLDGCLDDPDPSDPSPDITDPVTSCLFNDPCSQYPYSSAENFQCDADGACPPNTDCFDCDSFQQYKGSCTDCVGNGGHYCEFDSGDGTIQGVCSSPDIAATVPNFCSGRTSGTAYASEECGCPGSTLPSGKLVNYYDVPEAATTTTFAAASAFCTSRGATICHYDSVCPEGTLLGEPDCDGSPADVTSSDYLFVSSGSDPASTGCNAGEGLAVYWSGAGACTVNGCISSPPEDSDHEIIACCSCNGEGFNTWIKTTSSGDDISAECGGDPHFVLWNGKHFNYHGECDLVLLHVPDYRGKPLTVHIRSRGKGIFSIVEAVAVKYGDHFYEFNNEIAGNPKHYFGGEEIQVMPHKEAGFKISLHRMKNTDFNQDVLAVAVHFDSGRDKINIHMMGEFVFVSVDASKSALSGATGLLGSYPDGAMLGRDGLSDFSNDRDAYGSEWQVQPEEPQLFHAAPEGHPVAPLATCKLPEANAHEYLRAENAEFYQIAVDACTKEGLVGLDIDDCIFDVIILHDPKMAAFWWGAKANPPKYD